MIKLKSLLKENVVSFENDGMTAIIPTQKGNWKVGIRKYYNKIQNAVGYIFDASSPPDYYRSYVWNGEIRKMSVGGSQYVGTFTTSLEQCQAELSEFLKKKGLQYTFVVKLKVRDTTTQEYRKASDEFLGKLQNVVNDFNKEMQKPENQPKKFGAGPAEFNQWVSAEDVDNGRLKWVIDNYGDFWLVIKWSISPRQQIKASELLKNYNQIMSGKEAKGDYAREIFIRNEPYKGI